MAQTDYDKKAIIAGGCRQDWDVEKVALRLLYQHKACRKV
jgi:hypothetical protein